MGLLCCVRPAAAEPLGASQAPQGAGPASNAAASKFPLLPRQADDAGLQAQVNLREMGMIMFWS